MATPIDLNILAALSNRDRLRFMRSTVPDEMVDPQTTAMLAWFELYFNQYPDHHDIDFDAFRTMLNVRVTTIDADQKNVVLAIVEQVKQNTKFDVITTTVNQLEELTFAGKVGAALAAYNSGRDVDVVFEIGELARKTRERMMRTVSIDAPDDEALLDILRIADDDSGIQIKIPCLAGQFRGLHGGHNIMIAARTNKGKSSLLLRLAVDSAIQGLKLYPDRPVLYLINEGTKASLLPRLYITALGKPLAEVMQLAQDKKLIAEYEKVIGDRTNIRLVEVHGQNFGQIAKIIDQHEPFMVITDMTGRIIAPSNHTGGMNDINQLEEVWNLMREYAALKDFIHVGTAQVSQEGADMLFPPLSALQLSKTGIQTTLDLLLMLGALEDPAMAKVRGFSSPKSKLARAGMNDMVQIKTTFDKELNKWG